MPELSWSRFKNATDVVRVGQRVSCEFLQFDTWNLEARLSLRAKRPDPFQAFADGAMAGQGDDPVAALPARGSGDGRSSHS